MQIKMIHSTINKAKRTLLFFLLSCCIVFGARAQAFYAQVSSKKVQVGVPFEFAVVITVSAGNYVAPVLKDFDIVSGPNQSNSVQYSNGTMSQQLVISYGLVARKEGKFTIGAASIVSNGQKLETAPVVIEVVKGAVGQGGQGNDGTQNNSKVSGEEVFIWVSKS
jgi:hypothetical protein